MVTWETKRLGDIAEFRNGINYNKNSFGEGIKVVGVKDFQDYTKPKYADLEQINPEGIVTERNILRNGDIVFVRSNGNRELIGRSLYIETPPENITHSAFTIRLRFTSSEAYPKYYAYLFRTPLIRKGLTAYGGGTNISNLNQDILGNLEVPVPSLDVQRQITSILSAYDDLIENNTRRIRILEETARRIYHEWFVHFRFPGHEKAKFVDSPLGRIPQGWKIDKTGDRFKTVLGGTPSRNNNSYWFNGQIPWINSGKANDLRILEPSEYITDLGFAHSSTKIMPIHTTVVAITGATLGQVSLLEIETCANQSIVGIYDEHELWSEYIYLFFKNKIDEIIQHASGGAQQHINKDIINDVLIVLPYTELIEQFNLIVRPSFELIAILLWKNLYLRQTRDLLLPKLVSGEIEV